MGPITGLPGNPVFNVKLIPSVKKNSPPDVKQLSSSIVKDMVVHKVYMGEAKLEFGSTPDNPLKRIPILKLVRCVYSESDFTLDYGDIVYNYLNESK
jgi:acetoacetate decarboxylase